MPASSPARGIFQQFAFGGTTPPVFSPSFLGNLWFVDPVKGSDGNVGNQPAQAFKTLSGALTHVVAGNNDVVMFSGTVNLTATLAWNVNNTHLIGCDAPAEVGMQARINYAGSASLTPLVHVTGSGCYFANFAAVHAGTVASTAQICWQDSGQHNTYDGVQFAGMGATGQAGQTGSRCLLIDGGNGQATPTTGYGDMLFRRCKFGATAIARTAANATLEMQQATPRNVFRDCRFSAFATAAGVLHMLLGASAVDQWIEFNNSSFLNALKGASGTTMTQAFSINSTQTAVILFVNSYAVGVTKLETTPSNYVYVTEPAASAGSGPYAVNNT